VDAKKHDRTFIITFLAVVGFLHLFAFGIAVLANVLDENLDNEAGRVAKVEERLQPAGQVVTDPAMLLALAPPPAARAPMTAQEVSAKVCDACHATGVLGAPKTAAEWKARKAAGLDALVASAIKGKNAMPPRGGDPSLSDEEVKAAVQHLLKQAGA
jgi:cytochrome c5